MNDLYDDARTVRDAAMNEIDRLAATEQVCPLARESSVLGVHLTSVMMAFAANRHKTTTGPIQDEGFHQLLAGAFAILISNAAMGFRPIFNGQPAPPLAVARALLDMTIDTTMRQTEASASGLQDFVIPIRRNDAGALEVAAFDVRDLLKGRL